jgi:hypothetical protein
MGKPKNIEKTFLILGYPPDQLESKSMDKRNYTNVIIAKAAKKLST